MLFNDEPVIGIKDPRDYYYMKILKFTLQIIGSWPKRVLGEKCGKYDSGLVYLQMFLKSFGIGLTIWHIWKYSPVFGFVEIGHSYITVLLSFVTLSRGISLSLNPSYGKIMKKFITEMHTFHCINNSEYAMKTHLWVHKTSHILCMVLYFQMIGGIISFNGIPIYNNYSSGKWGKKILYNETYEYSLYYKIPYVDVLTDRNWCIILCIYNWYATGICSCYVCIYDLLLSLIIVNIYGHFKILIHNLSSFPKTATESSFGGNHLWKSVIENSRLYSPTEMAQASKNLKECINYHRVLVKFTQDISEVFGPMLFVYYIFYQISGCLLLLQCSQPETAVLVRYGLFTLVLFQQLIQLSVIIELVATVTGLLKDAVYNVPWEHMDTSNRKLLLIFLMNVQEPLHINALGLAKIGVQPMASILKTSLSYFAFLRSVSN